MNFFVPTGWMNSRIPLTLFWKKADWQMGRFSKENCENPRKHWTKWKWDLKFKRKEFVIKQIWCFSAKKLLIQCKEYYLKKWADKIYDQLADPALTPTYPYLIPKSLPYPFKINAVWSTVHVHTNRQLENCHWNHYDKVFEEGSSLPVLAAYPVDTSR